VEFTRQYIEENSAIEEQLSADFTDRISDTGHRQAPHPPELLPGIRHHFADSKPPWWPSGEKFHLR
jgi:hypothetical protein